MWTMKVLVNLHPKLTKQTPKKVLMTQFSFCGLARRYVESFATSKTGQV